jgi:bis(5'-nucleosidyl)-tetraphosphatase
MDGRNAKTLSAGVVVVRLDGPEPRYLLLRAYRNWDFPKGEVEAEEAPLETALREVEEETGLTGLDFRWGRPYHETPPYAGGKVARYYLAACDDPGSVRLGENRELGRPEHHEYRWLTASEAGGLLVDRIRRVLEWAVGVLQQTRD